MSRRRPDLRQEDRDLWQRVARSVRPLDPGSPLVSAGNMPSLEPQQPPPIPAPAPKRSGPPPTTSLPSVTRPTETPRLDARTVRRISRGRLEIDGRIDLHGMTREDAHARLHDFLAISRAIGRRTVLVITGKGFAGEGVLRREVPQWLATPAFRSMIAGTEQANMRHGGEGALYVRLKRA